MRVGRNADRMTTVTSTVYWVRVMNPCVSPYSAEMEPKVSPVAVSPRALVVLTVCRPSVPSNCGVM